MHLMMPLFQVQGIPGQNTFLKRIGDLKRDGVLQSPLHYVRVLVCTAAHLLTANVIRSP